MPAMDYARVAHLYDRYANTTLDVPYFQEQARRAAGPVLELMSGTGRLSVPLVEAGVDLCCVDASPEMLAILRRKLADRHLSAAIHEADITRLALGRKFALAFIPFHSFGEILTETAQLAALRAVAAHLAEGGRFICTLHNPVSRIRTEDGRVRLLAESEMPDGDRLLLWGVGAFDPPSRTVSGKQLYEIYDAAGMMRSRMAVDVRFALPGRVEFERLARRAGLAVQALHGDYAGGPFDEARSPFMIFELAKAG